MPCSMRLSVIKLTKSPILKRIVEFSLPYQRFSPVSSQAFSALSVPSEKYDLYLLSNNNPVALPYAEKLFEEAGFPIDTGFTKSYISYQMKMIKPSAEFFKAVMEDLGLPASEMLFIDDSQRNVDASIAAGLPAVHYVPGSDLESLIMSVLS